MKSLNNPTPVDAYQLYETFKNEFPTYLKENLSTTLAFDYGVVEDVLLLLVPELTTETVFTLTVTPKEITISKNYDDGVHNVDLLFNTVENFINTKVQE